MKATLVFIFGPNLKTKTLVRPRPKLNKKKKYISPKIKLILFLSIIHKLFVHT